MLRFSWLSSRHHRRRLGSPSLQGVGGIAVRRVGQKAKGIRFIADALCVMSHAREIPLASAILMSLNKSHYLNQYFIQV